MCKMSTKTANSHGVRVEFFRVRVAKILFRDQYAYVLPKIDAKIKIFVYNNLVDKLMKNLEDL